MRILNIHGFMGEADNKNYKALCGIISPEGIIFPQINYKGTAPSELLELLSAIFVIVYICDLGQWKT
ncbi:MAG: hypothetical protein IKO47_04560 [Ruminococcus sp.]|nr:hypothetical protein [Ruminococcus sp.]